MNRRTCPDFGPSDIVTVAKALMGTAAAGSGQERPGDGASPGASLADQITPELPEERPPPACHARRERLSRAGCKQIERAAIRPGGWIVVKEGGTAGPAAGVVPSLRRCRAQAHHLACATTAGGNNAARARNAVLPRRARGDRPARGRAGNSPALAEQQGVRPLAGTDGRRRAWTFYEGPPTANGMPGHAPRRGPRLQGRLPAVQDDEGLPRPPQGRLGLPRPAGRSSRSRRNSASPASRTSRRTASPSSTPSAGRASLRHVDAFEAMTEPMGYWVDLRRRLLDDGRRTTSSRSGGRSRRSSTRACWWRTTGSRPYCPRCETGAVRPRDGAQGLRDRHRPVGLRAVPAAVRPRGAVRAGSGPAGLDDDPVDAGVQHRPWPCTPTSTYVVARNDGRPTMLSWSPSRCWPRRSARAGRCCASCTGARAGAVDVPAAVRPGRHPPARTGSSRPTTSPPRTAPAWCTRRPRSAPTTWRSAAAYGLPVVNPVAPTGTSTTCRWSAGMFFKDADEPLVADLSERGLLFRHEPYEHSYPHCWRCHTPLLYYALPSWYIRTTAIKDRLLARERGDQLVARDDQARPLRRLAEQQRRLGAVAQPLLGHSPADVALRGRAT